MLRLVCGGGELAAGFSSEDGRRARETDGKDGREEREEGRDEGETGDLRAGDKTCCCFVTFSQSSTRILFSVSGILSLISGRFTKSLCYTFEHRSFAETGGENQVPSRGRDPLIA